MEKHSDGCKYCNVPLYIKVQQIAQPVLAPLTPVDVAWNTWVSKSGMSYVLLEHRFCPMCGAKMARSVNDEKQKRKRRLCDCYNKLYAQHARI